MLRCLCLHYKIGLKSLNAAQPLASRRCIRSIYTVSLGIYSTMPPLTQVEIQRVREKLRSESNLHVSVDARQILRLKPLAAVTDDVMDAIREIFESVTFISNPKVVYTQFSSKESCNIIHKYSADDLAMDATCPIKFVCAKAKAGAVVAVVAKCVDALLVLGRKDVTEDDRHMQCGTSRKLLMMKGEQNRKREWILPHVQTNKVVEELAPKAGLWVPQFIEYNAKYHKTKDALQDWETEVIMARYAGFADLDMRTQDIQKIMSGQVALLSDGVLRTYDTEKSVKEALAAHYRQCSTKEPPMTQAELLQSVPLIHKQMVMAIEMAECLPHGFALFTGNKGYHVLWKDPRHFFRVHRTQRSDKVICQHVLDDIVKRRSKWSCAPTDLDFDPAPHRPNAGLAFRGFGKPRKSTGLWPFLVAGPGADLTQPAFPAADTPPLTLQRHIVDFVTWVRRACPYPTSPGLRELHTTELRKIKRRNRSSHDFVDDAILVRQVCTVWMRVHKLSPVPYDDKPKHKKSMTLSVQTPAYPNREFVAEGDALEKILTDLGGSYWQMTHDSAPDIHNRMIPLHESHKTGRPMRFVLDIDNIELTQKQLSALWCTVVDVVGSSAKHMVVLETTDPKYRGYKWHIIFPNLVLQQGHQSALGQLLRDRLQSDTKLGKLRRLHESIEGQFISATLNDLIDEGPWKGTLRAPLCPKAARGGMLPGIYRPYGVWNADNDTVQRCDDNWMETIGKNDFQTLIRNSCITPRPDQKPIAVPAILTYLDEQAYKAKRAADEAAEAIAKRQKMMSEGSKRQLSSSPRWTARCLEIDAKFSPGTEAWCKQVVHQYLADPRTLASRDQAANVCLKVKTYPNNSWYVEASPPWGLCEVAGREHTNAPNVKWRIWYPENGANPRINQYCHSAKCKCMDWKQRSDKSPSYDIVQNGDDDM